VLLVAGFSLGLSVGLTVLVFVSVIVAIVAVAAAVGAAAVVVAAAVAAAVDDVDFGGVGARVFVNDGTRDGLVPLEGTLVIGFGGFCVLRGVASSSSSLSGPTFLSTLFTNELISEGT
jgi:hypothetical protein